MKKNYMVLLDIPAYEDILKGINFENDLCKYDEKIVETTYGTTGTDSGIILKQYLEMICDTTDKYGKHVGTDLLSGLNRIKEAIIAADKAASEGIEIKR